MADIEADSLAAFGLTWADGVTHSRDVGCSGKIQAAARYFGRALAALFLPITAVGSVLGVNLRSGLEGQSPVLYWAVVGIAFATGFLVRTSVTREERAAQ